MSDAIDGVLPGELDLHGYPLPPHETLDQWRQRCLAALDTLRESGRFDDRDSRGTSVAEHLAAAAVVPIVPTLERCPGRTRLAGNLMRNVANPGRINQGLKGTCAVTTVESYLAERYPAEYCRLALGLLAPLGEVELRGGGILMRDEESIAWSEGEARRSPISRLLQVAAMELAYPDLDYRNVQDGHFDPDSGQSAPQNTGTGVDLDAFDRLLEGATGVRWDTLSAKEHHISKLLAKLGLDTSAVPELTEDGPAIIARSAAAGEAAFVTLNSRLAPPEGQRERLSAYTLPHKVRVLRLDEADGRLFYEDPLDPEKEWMPDVETRIEDRWGTCSMAVDDFYGLMIELSYRPQFWRGE